jgi:hypothetical protein
MGFNNSLELYGVHFENKVKFVGSGIDELQLHGSRIKVYGRRKRKNKCCVGNGV